MQDAARDGTGRDTSADSEMTLRDLSFHLGVRWTTYWTGPRKRPKKQMKFDPTSKPGIFLGYVIHPGFHWRKEFAVASLKQINDASFDQFVTLLRVLKIAVPDRIEFPCQNRADAIREGRIRPDQLHDEEDEDLPPLEEQGPVRSRAQSDAQSRTSKRDSLFNHQVHPPSIIRVG